jgi:hypothetical protein
VPGGPGEIARQFSVFGSGGGSFLSRNCSAVFRFSVPAVFSLEIARQFSVFGPGRGPFLSGNCSAVFGVRVGLPSFLVSKLPGSFGLRYRRSLGWTIAWQF